MESIPLYRNNTVLIYIACFITYCNVLYTYNTCNTVFINCMLTFQATSFNILLNTV